MSKLPDEVRKQIPDELRQSIRREAFKKYPKWCDAGWEYSREAFTKGAHWSLQRFDKIQKAANLVNVEQEIADKCNSAFLPAIRSMMARGNAYDAAIEIATYYATQSIALAAQNDLMRKALRSLVLSVTAHPDYTGEENEEWTDLIETANQALKHTTDE